MYLSSFDINSLPEELRNSYDISPTGDYGIDSGRKRFKVTCKRCGEILHENTTGPDYRVGQHEATKFLVKLIYFKESGKFYSEGEYRSCRKNLFEIWREISNLKPMPGLSTNWDSGFILVNVPGHPHDHPHLILRSVS